MSRAVEVATGLRNPPDRQKTEQIPSREDEVKRNVAVASAPVKAKDGTTTFVSENRQYRLQLKALPDRMDPATGSIIKGSTKTALFSNGVYKTKDAETIELMRASDAFGRDFWDSDELEAKSRVVAEDNLVNTLMRDPALLNRVMDRVTRDEADRMPSPGAVATTTNP